MTIAQIVERLRYWGWRGAVDFAKGKVRDRMRRLAFVANAMAHPMRPKRGVTIVGHISSRNSISKVLRDLIVALKDAGVPFQTFDLDGTGEVANAEVASALTPRKGFRALRYSHVFEMFDGVFPALPGVRRHRIAFWEFDTGLFEAVQQLKSARSLIAMSDFNAEVFRKEASKGVRVSKLLYPFLRLDSSDLPSAVEMRQRFGIPTQAFVVFFNFDFGSSFSRKNPDGALRAFAEAFRSVPDAFLVFKTMQSKSHPDKLASLMQLAGELGVANRFVCVNNYLSTRELYGLTAACDCYLSLHRGEGFGLGIAEAMSLGKPAVVTDYSSTTEFCDSSNSIPVPYRLTDVPKEMHDLPAYRFVRHWAEPDIHAAAAALRRLYDDRPFCAELGERAARSVSEQFSSEKFKESINRLMG